MDTTLLLQTVTLNWKIPRYISAPLSGGGTYQLTADAVMEERHSDQLISTDLPVEDGSVVTDHAYKMPARLSLLYVWSMSSNLNTGLTQDFLRQLYQSVLQLQESRVLLDVYTGKRVYTRMLIEDIDCHTDKEREFILELRLALKEIKVARVTTFKMQTDNQASPEVTAPVIPSGIVNLLSGKNYNPNGLGS